ncbi:phospholipid N-methyltransferase [Bacillus thermophilus]|uniref:Phospholipid N-methyltransferase n=1 Tax=Siminovitchia thermophila TaxID=1245522 RepID=A0ABS2RD82_9BACI|nr:rRNA adenine N-6-methyltransferase family protein [Siminovitchia thermophila]MBM7717606.1 phospholipid N-methyltransferase [Siminovitchia thermophila]ONK21088.1 SAM-dependent methyltransferase [Bacillus sp. VT-16-64]
MKFFLFLFQYITNPRSVGAILPSSQFLGDKMLETVDFQKSEYIVEFGPGTGIFTEKLLKKRKPSTIILLVEHNKTFYSVLKEKFKEEQNLFIINGSAEDIEQYAKEYDLPYADYVISGLPFASLPKEVSTRILQHTSNILKENGRFITFQYTGFKKGLIQQFFQISEVKKEMRNMPPAYVFSCKPYDTSIAEDRHND